MDSLRRTLDTGTDWWVNTVQPPNSSDPTKTELIAAINAERTNRGLAALAEYSILSKGAQDWAAEMARMGRLTHGDFFHRLQAEMPNTLAAEDIAEGPDVKTVVQMWMSDRPHREAILGNYNLVGVGFAQSANGTTYWCVDFARN